MRPDKKAAKGQRKKPPEEDAMEEVIADGPKDSDEEDLLPSHDSDKGEDDEDSDEEQIAMSVPRKKTARRPQHVRPKQRIARQAPHGT